MLSESAVLSGGVRREILTASSDRSCNGCKPLNCGLRRFFGPNLCADACWLRHLCYPSAMNLDLSGETHQVSYFKRFSAMWTLLNASKSRLASMDFNLP